MPRLPEENESPCAEIRCLGRAQPARERYRALFLRASAHLAQRLNDAGARDDALAALDRAIEIEPLCEDLYRQVMVIEMSLGRRKERSNGRGRLKQQLESELNCSPDPETEHLARDIERAQRREHVTSASTN